MIRSLRAIAQARRKDPRIAESIVGIHVEGPHLSNLQGARGAHEVRHILDPNPALFDRWMEAADGLVKIVTIAPELPGSANYIRHVVDAGVTVSLGHSSAEPQHIMAAVEAGAQLSTHLGNGIPAEIPRHPNQIWSQLAADELTAMFILDGHHLPSSAATAMLRAKGLERSLMVSDSATLAGSPPGEYVTPVGGHVEVSEDGALRLPGSTLLAGSGACLLQCVKWATESLPFTIDELWPLASTGPGELLGVDVTGDALIIDDQWQVREVRLAGEPVYRAGT